MAEGAPAVEYGTSEGDPPPEASREVSNEAKIGQLYSEIRELVVEGPSHPEVLEEIEEKRVQLRELQRIEAEEMQRRAEARRHLSPGSGLQALEQARNLLEG